MYRIVSLLLLVVAFPVRAAEPIELNADLTEAPRRLFKATLKIPAQPGPATLHYPKWIQGEHQPTGPITDLSGVKIFAGGKPIPWMRDDVELHDFHFTVLREPALSRCLLSTFFPATKAASARARRPRRSWPSSIGIS